MTTWDSEESGSGPGTEPAIMIISDVHARYEVVEAQIAHAMDELGHQVSRVIVLGDFGMFAPNLTNYFRKNGCRFRRPVSFVEGNHEDFRRLSALVRDYADVVTYLPRASVHSFGPWEGLCLGGASYMDACCTPLGSEIRDEDIDACLAHRKGTIDLVLTHDCPTGIGVTNTPGLEHYGPPGVAGLTRLAVHLKPRYWFFGHHHRWHLHQQGNTSFYGLPQSWFGYALLFPDGEIVRVEHEVSIVSSSWWARLFRLR